MEMIQLTLRKVQFHFSVVNQAEQSYFAFTKKLKSIQEKWILNCVIAAMNIKFTWYKVNKDFLSVILQKPLFNWKCNT